jgi:hypothetical protein
MKINGKTLVLGVVLGLAAAMVMGAMGSEPAGPGRYQLSSSTVYVWVMDTHTGQVWTTERRDETTPSFISSKPVVWIDYGTPVKDAGR